MGFYFQDDFWEACSELPKKDRDAAAAAIVAYYFDPDEKPSIKGASKAVFIAFRERIDLSRKRSNAGKSKPDQNDDQTKDQSSIKPKATGDQSGNQNRDGSNVKPDGHLLKGESEREKDLKEPPLPPLDECDNEAAAFAVEALAAFNAITGQDVRDMPGDAWCGLRRVFDAGRTIDDVKAVIEKKNAEWKDDKRMARFVRPSTLFGDKFDEYLNQKDEGGSSAETSEYAATF